MKELLSIGLTVFVGAAVVASTVNEAVDAAYAFYLDEPERIWPSDADFIAAVFGSDFVVRPPADAVVFSYRNTGDSDADVAVLVRRSRLLRG